MKSYIALFFLLLVAPVFATNEDPNVVVQEMTAQLVAIQKSYLTKKTVLYNQQKAINQKLKTAVTLEEKINALLEKDQIREQFEQLDIENATDVSKTRYLKGLEIIKILYEKVLGLDHHFASVRSFSEISKISNPNQYPEFDKVKELIKAKKDKKSGFDVSSLLGNNPIISIVTTFSNMLVSSLSKEEKESELAKIDCIVDFTLRMQTDLNTIYFETSYLQSANESLKQDIETLFRDYTKPLQYSLSIKECRSQDDWDTVKTKLENYLTEMAKAQETQKLKMNINIEFPVDRLIQFITLYNNFIDKGEKYYQKFDVILNSYENEKQCESKLPIEFKKLKADNQITIEKFNAAYKPVEINGSKMKELLYGIND